MHILHIEQSHYVLCTASVADFSIVSQPNNIQTLNPMYNEHRSIAAYERMNLGRSVTFLLIYDYDMVLEKTSM